MAERGAAVFSYAPIDQSTESFRLLRIRKGRGIMICCDLFQAHLTRPDNRTEAISYEALSYVWGSDRKERNIEINGKHFRVTINLYDALQQLKLPDQDRIVWVDAICINQNDNKERGHQVRHMSSIYKRAARVVYWLGSPTWMTNHCLNALRVLEKKSRPVAGKDWTREQWGDLWDACRGTNRAQQREGLRDLLSRPWFERVWILQEVAHSHAAVVCCGKAFVSARIFGMAPFLMDLRPTRHCQAILDMMPGPFRQKSWFGEKVTQNLATLLDHFGDSKASDPRDLIFALLSMATDALGHITQYYEQDELSVLETVFAFLFRIELSSIPAALRPTELREFCGRVTHYATIVLERAFQDKTSSKETTAFIITQFPKLPIKFPTLLCAANYGVKARDILDTLFTSMSPEPPPQTWYPSLMKAAASNETAGEQAVDFLLTQTANTTPITEDTLVAAASNHQKGAHLMHLLCTCHGIDSSHITSNVTEAVARNGGCGEEITLALSKQGVQFHLDERVLRAAASNTATGKSIIEGILTGRNEGDEMLRTNIEHVLNWVAGLADNGKISLFRQAASNRNGTEILKLLLDWIPIQDDPIAQQSLVRASRVSLGSVKLLVAHRADVNIRDMAEAQTTPLAAATAVGRGDIVRFLLDNNADACLDGSFRGASPIHLAVRRGFGHILAMMLERTAPGIGTHCRDHDDCTPLHYAAHGSCNTAVVDLLIQQGASINDTTKYGITPLLLAVEAGNINICRSLLDHDADIELGPWTPLALAVKCNDIAVGELLLSRGASTEAELELLDNKVTLLMYAAFMTNAEMVKLLLAYGSDPYKEVAQMNALQWAYEGSRIKEWDGHQSCIELLEKHMECSPTA